MKKNVKNVVLSLASVTCAFAAFGATVTLNQASAATDAIDSFKMVYGASIRTVEGSTGIRFMADFNADLYNAVAEDENKEFGMLITKLEYYQAALDANEDLVAGLNSLGENKYELVSESSANPVKPYAYKTGYRINGALTGIQYEHADWTWIGVGVVITTGETTTYEYATLNNNARTTARIASAALSDVEEGYTENQNKIFKSYVYEYTAKASNLTEEEFTALENKASVMEETTVALTGLDTSKDWNTQLDGKDTILTVDEVANVDGVVYKNGKALDIFVNVATDNAEVVTVEDGKATAVATGYATLTAASEFVEATDTVTVYTGSESVAKFTETTICRASGAQDGYVNYSETGTIKGEEYYGYAGRGSSSQNVEFWAYSDTMSVYYLDYMIAQGYKYVRMPFYCDTSLTHELFEGVSEADKCTNLMLRPQFGTNLGGAGAYDGNNDGKSDGFNMILDDWMYYDVDINHYRAEFTENGAAIDEYGIKTGIDSSNTWWNCNALILYVRNTLVYFGEQTFVKESSYTVNQDVATATLGEVADLRTKFTSNEVALSYSGENVENDCVFSVYEKQGITLTANIFTEAISSAGKISISKAEDVTKYLTVEGGAKKTNLVDVNGKTEAIAFADFDTKASELEELGFDTSVSFVKRYSDGTPLTEETIAVTERGIFYASVTASKDGKEYNYNVTLDIYNSAEPIEYESFGHGDSAYAVKVYYVATTWANSNNKSFETLKSTYTEASGKGLEMTVGDKYVSLPGGNISASGKSTGSAKTVYGDDISNIYWLSIDQSQIDMGLEEGSYGPLKVDTTKAAGGAYIYVYVTPRHTVEYYSMYEETNADSLLKYSYAQGRTNGASTCRLFKGISEGKGVYTSKQNESANWQQTQGTSSTITLSQVVENYAKFDSREIAVFVVQDPQGFITTKNNGIAGLASILFI